MPKATANAGHKWLQLDDDLQDLYNSHDVVATARVYKGLLRELQKNDQLDFWRTEVWPTVPVVMRMQGRGLQVDMGRRTAYRKKVRRELAETEYRIHQFTKEHSYRDFVIARKAGKPLWLNSTQSKEVRGGKRAAWLYDELGFKVPPKANDRPIRSTNTASLKWILEHLRKMDEANVPALHALFHRSRLNTIDVRYLSFTPDPDGRVRPRIKDFNVETGRLAYADPPLQQYPEEARCFIVAKPDHVFIAADYSQLEARIQAVVADDTVTLQALAAGISVHCQNAADLFTGSPSDYKKGSKHYDYSKSFLYKLTYGGSAESEKEKIYCPCTEWGCAQKLALPMDLTRQQKIEMEERWWRNHQPVRRWRNQLLEKVRFTHCHTTALGRKRFFFAPYPTFKRELFNFEMQADAADIIKRAMRTLDGMGAPLVLQMHDELVLEVPKVDAAYWRDTLGEVMEAPVPELKATVFPVEIHEAEVWGDL